MTFSINDIRSELQFGGARPSLFRVQITNPITQVAELKIPFLTVRAELPATTLGSIAVPYFGRKVYIAGDRNYQPWTVTIINDEDFLIRHSMERWSYAINSFEGNRTQLVSPLQYKSQASVTQFGKDGTILREYVLKGIFPTEVSNIGLDWNTQDQIEEFNITFLYDSFEVFGSTGVIVN